MKILIIHPAHMDYRKDLFENLNSTYSTVFLFTKQGRGQKNVFEEQEALPSNWDYRILKTNLVFLGKDLGMYFQLAWEILHTDADVIITSTSWHVCWFLCKIKNSKFILMSEFWYWRDSSFYRRFVNMLTRTIAKRSDAIFSMGTKSCKSYFSMGVNPNKLFMYPQCAIDYSNNSVHDLEFTLNFNGKIKFLFIGRLVDSKGVNILIKAFSILEQKCGDSILIIGGEGPEKSKLEALSKDLGIKNIIFIGRIEKKYIASYYSLCDVFVLPSIFINESYEPWGLVVNEAMAFSKPVITTFAVGSGYDMVKDGQNGYIVKEGSVDELYEAMRKISSNKQNLIRMGKKSRTIFEEKNNYELFFQKLNECIKFSVKSK